MIIYKFKSKTRSLLDRLASRLSFKVILLVSCLLIFGTKSLPRPKSLSPSFFETMACPGEAVPAHLGRFSRRPLGTWWAIYYCSRQLNNLRQKCIISAVAETPSRFFSISKGITEIYRMKQIANAVIIYKSPMRSFLKYTGGSTSAQFNCAFLYLCSIFVFTSINGELQR